jgi:hypothetical protein
MIEGEPGACVERSSGVENSVFKNRGSKSETTTNPLLAGNHFPVTDPTRDPLCVICGFPLLKSVKSVAALSLICEICGLCDFWADGLI